MDENEIAAGILASGSAAAVTIAAGPSAPMIGLGAAMSVPVLQEIYGRIILRFTELIEEAALGGDVKALEAHLSDSPRAANLVLAVAEATTTTEYPTKVEALGQALRDGVLYETGTKFDVEAHIISVMCRTERLHVMVLACLEASEVKPTREDLADELPELGIALSGTVQELTVFGLAEAGIAYEGDGTYRVDVVALTPLGFEVIRRFRAAGERTKTPPPTSP